MEKMWKGRTDAATDAIADDFNSSIRVDSAMYMEDIKGSIAHVFMLGKQGIITREEQTKISDGLLGILSDIHSGKLEIDMAAEDIHMFVEAELTKRIGDVGKKLHTARSRNDQVALDTRLYLRRKNKEIISALTDCIAAFVSLAEKHKETIMPGYTHLQRAQPVSFAQYMLAYANMLLRDIDRFAATVERMNYSPLGACALAGTTYDTDRELVAKALKMYGVCENSMDAVSDRDFCLDTLSSVAISMMHLSRISEELILWSTGEFGFVEIDDAYTTGSSIMPQKKNPDMAELIRGKTGRAYGNLVASLTMMKGLPLAYNKDMQEDKESVFDSVDTLLLCLSVLTPMLNTIKVNKKRMRDAANGGFITATDLADMLVKENDMPFRDAYKLIGEVVRTCIDKGETLESLPIEEYKKLSPLFDEGLYEVVNPERCLSLRTSQGGTAPSSVEKQLELMRERLSKLGK